MNQCTAVMGLNSSKSSFNGSKPESRRGSIEQLILANAVNDEENELFLSQAAEIDDKFCRKPL